MEVTLYMTGTYICPKCGSEMYVDYSMRYLKTPRVLRASCVSCPQDGCPWHGRKIRVNAIPVEGSVVNPEEWRD